MAYNTPRGQRKEGLFSRISRKLNFYEWLSDKLHITDEVPVPLIQKVVFAFLLLFVYISFQHNIETLTRDISKAETLIKEKRASFISHKSAYMFQSKHSQVSASLSERGLNRNIEPPIKIVAK